MNRVKELRESKGLNQRQLSELSHTPQSLVSAIETGRIQPWPKVIKRLSKALKISSQELFSKNYNP